MERPRDVVVTAAVEGPDPVDGIRVRRSEHDDGNVRRAAEVGCERVRRQHEVRPRRLEQLDGLAVQRLDDIEPVLPKVPLEKPPRRWLRLGEKQCVQHAGDATNVFRARPDVHSNESVTKNRQSP